MTRDSVAVSVAGRARRSPTTVYRYFDADGALLYVGITSSLHARATQHSASSKWWRLAKTATLTHYPSRAKAEEAEIEAIHAEHPIYNVVHAFVGPRWYRAALVRFEAWHATHPDVWAINGTQLAGFLGVTPRRALLVMRELELPHKQPGRSRTWIVAIDHVPKVIRELCDRWTYPFERRRRAA